MSNVSQYYNIQDSTQMFGSQNEIMSFIKGLLLKNFKIYEIVQKQGELVPYHTHSHEEMILVLDGKMRMIIEEDIVDLKAGDLITIQPWAIHLASFPDNDGARFYLCFPKKISSKP